LRFTSLTKQKILDGDPSLHFALLRLQLVELIRTCTSTPGGDISPVLNFATTQLAPRAPTKKEFLEDLEKTMALLIFSPDDLAPPLAGLLDRSLRQKVANDVKEAILLSQGARRKAQIRDVVELRQWAEKEARESKKDLPNNIDLGLEFERHESNEDSEMQNNGELETMVT